MEVQGYSDAARWVYGQAMEPDDWSDSGLITLNEVRRIHHMAMTPVWGVAPHPEADDLESPGHFRRHDIVPFDGGMTPPSWPDVPSLLDDWVRAVVALGNAARSGDQSRTPLPERLAGVHHQFECIHPFLDGNGRAGRLALNLILVRLGYPPVVIFKKQRSAYLRALKRADYGDCAAPLAKSSHARCLTISIASSFQTLRARRDLCRSPPLLMPPSVWLPFGRRPSVGGLTLFKGPTVCGVALVTPSTTTPPRNTCVGKSRPIRNAAVKRYDALGVTKPVS